MKTSAKRAPYARHVLNMPFAVAITNLFKSEKGVKIFSFRLLNYIDANDKRFTNIDQFTNIVMYNLKFTQQFSSSFSYTNYFTLSSEITHFKAHRISISHMKKITHEALLSG